MCLAEEIAFKILYQVGFREPTLHPQWTNCVALAQDKIDGNMKIMEQVAARAACVNSKKTLFQRLSDWIERTF